MIFSTPQDEGKDSKVALLSISDTRLHTRRFPSKQVKQEKIEEGAAVEGVQGDLTD